ncbi:UBX domain-containing protein 7 [Episyrphus balteatus]|uniref:UBX domain-containing protein 7 n=1 Tax=Episyrphus balteatus TaxID=286459 RepID=UPI00248690DB|nr:UBX domain-containing protein 7 [Episyrphus balteatus]
MSSVDLAACVMEVTGSTRQVALSLLAACANDVQAAVNLFLANEEESGEVDVESVADIVAPGEDEVRAPIAPKREQLIGPDDDNFRHASQTTGAKGRSLPRIKVCPLRDFAREGSLMEESLAGSDAIMLPSVLNDRPTRSSKSTRALEMSRRARSSTSTSSSSNSSVGRLGLGDLFRPPTDLTVAGTFQYARTKATSIKRWLLVNVQSDNFNSQLLNRDVWSQIKVRDLIKTNFLLWQVSSDTSEGARFSTFYHCNETPYISIIDPRTGEELWKTEHPNKIDFLESLQVFLSEHASEGFFQSDSTKPGPSSSMQSNTEKSLTRTVSSALHRKRTLSNDHATELSEEEQIMLAVRNSLQENGFANNSSKKSKTVSEDEEEAFQEISDSDDDSQNTPVKYNGINTQDLNKNEKVITELHTAYLGASTDEITTLKIRLVNAGVDESVTIKWPSDTKLRALQLYISEHFPTVNEKFKLISPFPRKIVDLDEENLMQTLKDANLHPSSTLHVHLDD